MSSSLSKSWGMIPRGEHSVRYFRRRGDDLPNECDGSILPYGKGRSYGDCCLNIKNTLLDTSNLDRFISLDGESGVLHCESGVSLHAILDVIIPKGWFLPVTPGTQFVSVGGAIANDIHGKNHHCAGTFGCHVLGFELLRSDGSRQWCSADQNSELFSATIGGLGLTGLITQAKFQLKKIEGPFIDEELIKFSSIDEFFEISRNSSKKFEYTMAWLDCLAQGASLGRGIFMRGNHSARKGEYCRPKIQQILTVPVHMPSFVLNKLSVKAFNTAYYHRLTKKFSQKVVPYEPFFYPLDAVQGWNKIYGKRGFFQFQCVVPESTDHRTIREILTVTAKSGKASFLVVAKEFGDIESPGMLSFPRPGLTLCLDFAHEGPSTLQLLKQLERLVVDAKGALYPAKDALMSPDSYQQFYPRWKEFQQYIDPKFSSSFWRRVTREELNE